MKITLNSNMEDKILFALNSYLVGGFINNLEEFPISTMKVNIKHEKVFITSHITNINGFTNAGVIYNIDEQKENQKLDTIILKAVNNQIEVSEILKCFKYLCEYIFLVIGFYPEYTEYEIKENENVYKVYVYKHKYQLGKRKKFLIKEEFLVSFDKTFKNWCDFRSSSGIIFDIFMQTVYSQTFEEDYPLRLSQCLEGLIHFLIDKKKKLTFKESIENAILITEYNEGPFSEEQRSSFLKKLKKHRNLFSHGMCEKEKLVGKENRFVAFALSEIIRNLIIKRINGEEIVILKQHENRNEKEELKEENDKLKEENDKLREQNLKLEKKNIILEGKCVSLARHNGKRKIKKSCNYYKGHKYLRNIGHILKRF